MRDGSRNESLASGRFLAEAQTRPQYRLYDCGTYPGLVNDPSGIAIEGEVWEVSPQCLTHLDLVEGVGEGLYARREVLLEGCTIERPIEAYFYLQDVSNKPRLGRRWVNRHPAARQRVSE